MDSESATKRRKIRKGTHSCWECKRRKLRCLFEHGSPANAICIGCRRRGTRCVSQEFPEKVSAPLEKALHMRDRVVRVEDQLEELIRKVGKDEPAVSERPFSEETPNSGMLYPTPTDSESSRLLDSRQTSEEGCMTQTETIDGWVALHKLKTASLTSPGPSEHERLSQALLETLPSREDTEMIVKARGYVSVFFHGLENPETLLEPPDPKLHPALIARHMLYLATFLQHLHPAVHEEIKGLSETPKVIVQRLANTAISLVTTNDELIGSIEGLECVKIEASYWLNWGNLRRSLIVIRRAVVIAQLMGLHRSAQYKVLDPKTKVDTLAMWDQILRCDRALCLQLGLPQASHDLSMGSDAMLAGDIPMGRLERMHSVISSRILARNETIGSFQDFSQTQKFDMELQKAAKLVPSKWWLIPSLTGLTHDALSAETRRIFDQMCHYNLLNLLHLPHLLRSSAEHKFEYSRMMCVNASREILSRFNAFRSYNRVASSFRAIDFLAFIAGITLLLAHLDSHRFPPADNLLAHQSFSDRAMIEQVQDNMVEVGRLNTDPLSVQSADLLRRLSAIELQVAEGNTNPAANLQSPLYTQNLDLKQRDEHDNRIVPDPNGTGGGCIVSELCARFGLIQMCNDETLFKLRHPEASRSQTQLSTQPSQLANPTMPSTQVAAASAEMPGFNGAAALQPVETVAYPQLFPGTTEAYQYADLTAGVEDWAFQGVDMAFVDSLMRGAGEDEAWFH